MSKPCSVCVDPRRAEVDRAIVAGVAVDEIARRYPPLSATSIRRHRDEHIPKAVAKAHEEADIAHGLDVVRQLRTINGVTMQILSEARQRKDPDVALKAIDRIQRQIELQAKLLGDLDERPVINVLISPEWLRLRATIIAALGSYPEAKQAVVMALGASAGVSA